MPSLKLPNNTFFAIVAQQAGLLFPEELALIPSHASEAHKTAFTLGRMAAHLALEELGANPQPILRGSGGEPLWPDGISGSISHTGTCGCALVGHSKDYTGIGVDLQVKRPLAFDIKKRVCTAAERLALENADEIAALLVFSAKESIYKSLYPRVRRFFGFHAAELRSPLTGNSLDFELMEDLSPEYPQGRTLRVLVAVDSQSVLSACLVDSALKNC